MGVSRTDLSGFVSHVLPRPSEHVSLAIEIHPDEQRSCQRRQPIHLEGSWYDS